ncbi:MAG: hypothetical protein ACRD2B_05090 [Terriglobia bacterium]
MASTLAIFVLNFIAGVGKVDYLIDMTMKSLPFYPNPRWIGAVDSPNPMSRTRGMPALNGSSIGREIPRCGYPLKTSVFSAVDNGARCGYTFHLYKIPAILRADLRSHREL